MANRYGISIRCHGYVPFVAVTIRYHSLYHDIMTDHWIFNKINTGRVAPVGQVILTFLDQLSPTRVLSEVYVAQSLVFCVHFCRQ